MKYRGVFTYAMLVVTGIVFLAAPVCATEEVISFKYVDAREIADLFWDTGYHRAYDADVEDFVWGFANDVVRDLGLRLPYTECQWSQAAQTRKFPKPIEGGRYADLLPRQVHRLVEVVPSRNAIVVNGSQIAINQFRETLKDFDVPSASVYLTVHWISVPARELADQNLDWSSFRGDDADAPGLYYARVSSSKIDRIIDMAQPYNHVQTAHITVESGAPGVFAFADVYPYLTPTAVLDEFDSRPSDRAQVRMVFHGVVIPVIPYVAKDGVKLYVRPSTASRLATVENTADPQLSLRLYRTAEMPVDMGAREALVMAFDSRDMKPLEADFRNLEDRIRPELEYSSIMVVTPEVIPYREPRIVAERVGQ